MKYINQLKKVEHCEVSKSYFFGISNRLGSFFNQYFSFINYIDKQKTLTSEQKEEYIKMLNLQNDNFCQLVIYYYLKSALCKAEELEMNKKYKLLPRIDKSLLFHLNPNDLLNLSPRIVRTMERYLRWRVTETNNRSRK
jgi:hypothetical protein